MKVLVIDDHPDALKQIQKALSGATGPDGNPYEVLALRDYKEAMRRLEVDERFDAVVTDLVMGVEETEGLEVLRKLTGKSPITIVLTAYPSIPTCVEAMRAGTWDYLEKNPAGMSDPYENLLRSLQEGYKNKIEHPEAGKVDPDTQWIQQHLADLLAKHPGETIAVLDQKLVDHDTDFAALMDRVEKEYQLAKPVVVTLPDSRVEVI
jgi:DNA-binding NtrC family response regulator